VFGELLDALSFAFGMFWEILWALILGFALSGAVQAVVSKSEMRRLMPDDSPRSLCLATGLGAASSSCSYAAVALARSLFRKGANFTAAMAFEFASTNLVIELGIIMALLLGWQFTLGEFVGGPLMIVLLALAFRIFLKRRLVEEARSEAERGVLGRMEGHAEMDMSVQERAPLWRRLTSPQGFTATANHFVMDWAAIWIDIFGGLLIAGALAAWVPDSWWRSLFLENHDTLDKFWGPVIGPVVAIISFVCSIGNVPLAAVLWNGGISFGGVLAFIFADLIVLPILDIYRKYYGWRMARIPTREFLRDDGRRGTNRRVRLRRAQPDPERAQRKGRRSERDPQLHDRPEHHLPQPGRAAHLALLPPRRRHADAEDDERTDGARAPTWPRLAEDPARRSASCTSTKRRRTSTTARCASSNGCSSQAGGSGSVRKRRARCSRSRSAPGATCRTTRRTYS